MSDKSTSAPAFDFSGEIAIHYEQCPGPMFFEPYVIEVSKRL